MFIFARLGLVAGAALLTPAPLLAQPARQWVQSWQAPPVELQNADSRHAAEPLGDVTFRTVVRISAGGSAIRLRLSNELSSSALSLGSVHVARSAPDGTIVPGSDHVVTFSAKSNAVIPPFAPLLSDPVSLNVPPLSKLVVSIHAPGDASGITVHQLGVTTTQILPGDQTTAPVTATAARTSTMRYILSGVDVSAPPSSATIVAFGDSITDGALSTDNTDRRWPDILAERLQAAGMSRFAVANAGISGNRLLATGAGPAALARFDRDVLAVPGVRYLILLEGINDIGFTKNANIAPPAPEDLIAAYRQLIARAHDHGIKVFGVPILPYKGAGYRSEEGDAVRQAVNRWIRTPGNFDAVIDMDRAVANPVDPLMMAPAFDSGDRLHPKDAGYRAMAEAIDLKLFR